MLSEGVDAADVLLLVDWAAGDSLVHKVSFAAQGGWGMSGDYKYEAYLLADERAQEQFGTDFYSLSHEQQMELYGEAMQTYVERRIT